MIFLKLIEIAIIVVIIIDLTDLIPWIKSKASKVLGINNLSLKPLDCSLCATFWCGLCYTVPRGYTSLEVLTFILVLAYLSSTIKEILMLIKDFINLIIIKLNNYFSF